MYVPQTELQNYRGQMYCPYCLQDLRDEETSHQKHVDEQLHLDPIAVTQKCERCGKEISGRVQMWNGKKLCKECVEDGKKEWGTISGSPDKGGNYAPAITTEEKTRIESQNNSFMKKLDNFVSAMKKESRLSNDKSKKSQSVDPQIVSLSKDQIKNEIELEKKPKKHNPEFAIPTVMVSQAKPFTEGIISDKSQIVQIKKEASDRDFSPQNEGIMGKPKKKAIAKIPKKVQNKEKSQKTK